MRMEDPFEMDVLACKRSDRVYSKGKALTRKPKKRRVERGRKDVSFQSAGDVHHLQDGGEGFTLRLPQRA
jgi:hypothetical protein